MDLGHNVRVVEINDCSEARPAIKEVGADATGIKWMAPKAVHRVLKVEGLPLRAAVILKQEMLSRGGEAAISREAGGLRAERTDVLLMGTLRQYEEVCKKLRMQPFGLSGLAGEIKTVLDNLERRKPFTLRCRDLSLTIGERTLVMGILNVTPDSFSDGGKFIDVEAAVSHARQMVEDGADIIDLGGESTRVQANPVFYGDPSRPWSWEPLPVEEELRRIMPVLERLLEEIRVPISIDTYKAETAKAALQAGAHMINDVWGFQYDPRLAEVAAEYDVPVILMHNRQGTEYRDLMGEIMAFLRRSIKIAEDAGVRPEQIIIDPGIGFGKTLEQNLEVLRRLREFRSLGKPILLGTSRKSVIGRTLNLPPDQRVEGTAATVALGIACGADIVRVHDVKEMVRVARMTDAILNS
ncbi:MAG TPA: dihydropteroate synthase [Syntrophomonadaceae bacterium]|nr:dihydropteroate synthase [Syntrophomonadaceae bacterium]